MATVGVVLSGCGRLDGSEIHESACTLLALAQHGATIECFAPNTPQADVMNHLESSPLEGETRNVLIESARIARGKIKDLALASGAELDAVIFPGGYGAVKNLCTFAADGPHCKVNRDVERIILELHKAGKPIGALCIAPVIVARVLGGQGIRAKVTIGNDKATASAIETMGAEHVACAVDDCIVDPVNKLVTTPCYMLARSIDEVFTAVNRLVTELLGLI